jgi:hypothetical protein
MPSLQASSPPIEPPRRWVWRGVPLALAAALAAMYFSQGLCDPTEGLPAQPLIGLLERWGHGPAKIAAFTALLAAPWAIKPLLGLLTDFVPLPGPRRKGWLMLAAFLASLSFAGAWLLPLGPAQPHILLAILLAATTAVACGDVAADGLMVEQGRRLGITGRLQAIQWGAMYSAVIVAGWWGGYLNQHRLHGVAYAACAAMSLLTMAVACLVREPRSHAPAPAPGGSSWPALAGMAAFLFLGSFNPFSNALLQLHATKVWGLSAASYGQMAAMVGVGALAACAAYGAYCPALSRGWLYHLSIVLGIASTAVYLLVRGLPSGMAVSALAGLAYMTATLMQFDLAAQVCPPRAASTAFALLMGLSNASAIVATHYGGAWYEHWQRAWGASHAFHLLVSTGAAFTASCWLSLPLLNRWLTNSPPMHTAPRHAA